MQSKDRLSIIVALAAIVGALWFYPWLDAHRAPNRLPEPQYEFFVTNSANNGPGSLREAIFQALRSGEPSLISLQTEEVDLITPLPPLIGGAGITIRSDDGRAVIQAGRLEDAPVIDVRAGPVVLQSVEIQAAPAAAISVSADTYVLVDGVVVTDSDIGVSASGPYRLDVTHAEFAGNRIGVELLGVGTGAITDNTFTNQADSGIWIIGQQDRIADSSLEISGNRFGGARYGIVIGNATAQLRDNAISGFTGDGVHALGGILEVSGNEIWNGRGTGIRSIGLVDGSISGNDVHENDAIGIIVQSASGARIDNNRLYRNAFGIVTVRNLAGAALAINDNLIVSQNVDGLVAVGDSPSISDNRALENRAAGIRILHLVLPDSIIRSAPILARNVLMDNGIDQPVFAEYRLEPEAGHAQ